MSKDKIILLLGLVNIVLFLGLSISLVFLFGIGGKLSECIENNVCEIAIPVDVKPEVEEPVATILEGEGLVLNEINLILPEGWKVSSTSQGLTNVPNWYEGCDTYSMSNVDIVQYATTDPDFVPDRCTEVDLEHDSGMVVSVFDTDKIQKGGGGYITTFDTNGVINDVAFQYVWEGEDVDTVIPNRLYYATACYEDLVCFYLYPVDVDIMAEDDELKLFEELVESSLTAYLDEVNVILPE